MVGQLASSSDTGYFKVQLPAGASLSAHLTVPAQSDFDLYIYNSNGTLIAKSENGLGVADDARFRFHRRLPRSAMAGDDWSALSGWVQWAAGEGTRTLTGHPAS